MTFFFRASAAVAAQTAWTPPSGHGAPSRVLGVRAIVITPRASGSPSSDAIDETGVASGGGASAGGQVSAGQATADMVAQTYICGDAIPLNGLVLVNAIGDGEQPVNP